ncbi:MAG TPA: hypothetical protein VHL79_18365 [Ramlibacter sp.]|nr:hypothetical protein [Ramlibacter sp.]
MQQDTDADGGRDDGLTPNGRRRYPGMGPLLLAAVLAGVAYWYFYTPKSLRFREQVQLAGGEVVDVLRVVRAMPYSAIGGGGWNPVQQSLWIEQAGVPGVHPPWQSDAGLAPVLVDKDPITGQWLLVATTVSCEGWYALGKPRLPYAEFRLVQGRWSQVPLTAQAMGRDANVTTRIRFDGEEEVLTLADKAKRRLEPGIPPQNLTVSDRWSAGC